MKKIAAICHGNILRSQVLDLFLKYQSQRSSLDLDVYSAGIAPEEFYPHTKQLLAEIECELKRRGVFLSPERKIWNLETERKVLESNVIIAADEETRKTVLELLKNKEHPPVYTFYGFIGEGEKDFKDTYDRSTRRQDPVLFKNAFDELWRISSKILDIILDKA